MRVDADQHLKEVLAANGQEMGARYKLKHDPRITKVGNFIRKTSLDELPQFFDVFMGSMSVVGPRPQRDFEVQEYDPVYATRLLVKPGITGPWQVSGRNDLDEEESRQLDVSYVQDWSVMGDIVYIMRTIGTVLHPSGAY
nr:sugar transferase [Bifidobacterium pseudolongum]